MGLPMVCFSFSVMHNPNIYKLNLLVFKRRKS